MRIKIDAEEAAEAAWDEQRGTLCVYAGGFPSWDLLVALRTGALGANPTARDRQTVASGGVPRLAVEAAAITSLAEAVDAACASLGRGTPTSGGRKEEEGGVADGEAQSLAGVWRQGQERVLADAARFCRRYLDDLAAHPERYDELVY